MQAINAEAAASSASHGLVSDECIVLSFRSDGSGVLHLSNQAVATPWQFPHITYGMNQAKMLEDVFENLRRRPGQRAAWCKALPLLPRRPVPARGPFDHARSPSRSQIHRRVADLRELTAPDFELMSARDISDSGHVVGTGRLVNGGPQNIPWMLYSGGVERSA